MIAQGRIFAALALLLAAWPAFVAAQDGGVRDGGVRDAAARDGGVRDAAVRDGAVRDGAAGVVDAGVLDAGASVASVGEVRAPVPMLAVGPNGAPREVFATAAVPARAFATMQRAPLITAGELAAEINRRVPALRAAYVDPQRVEELARDMVRDRVLAEAARRALLLDDAEVKRELERTLARVLIERALAADPPPLVDETAARAFYDQHVAEYTKPEQVRLLAIVLPTREEAVRVLAEVSRVGERRFEAVARRRSTDAQSRRRGGSLGWLYVGSRPEAALIEAAFALRVGEAASAPLEVDGRFYVLRSAERRAPEPVPFERARSAVVSRLRAEHRQRVIDVILARTRRDQGVVVRPAAALVRVAPP